MRVSRTTWRLLAAAAVLGFLWMLAVELPLLHWTSVAAARLRGAGIAGAVLWSPAAAFACSGSTSAVNVYKECIQTGSGSS